MARKIPKARYFIVLVIIVCAVSVGAFWLSIGTMIIVLLNNVDAVLELEKKLFFCSVGGMTLSVLLLFLMGFCGELSRLSIHKMHPEDPS